MDCPIGGIEPRLAVEEHLSSTRRVMELRSVNEQEVRCWQRTPLDGPSEEGNGPEDVAPIAHCVLGPESMEPFDKLTPAE